jgi:hypothetical protein
MEIGLGALNFFVPERRIASPPPRGQTVFSSYYFAYLFNLSACDKSGSRVYPGAVKGIVSLRVCVCATSAAARESKTHDCALHCWEGVGRPRERVRERHRRQTLIAAWIRCFLSREHANHFFLRICTAPNSNFLPIPGTKFFLKIRKMLKKINMQREFGMMNI